MITPIIMELNIEVVREKLESLQSKKIQNVHIDIGDGLFSDLLTIAPADLQQFDLSDMKLDLHLLVDDPSEWIEECSALKPNRLIGQVEHMGSQGFFLDSVKGYGVPCGLALEINTPISEIEKESLDQCDVILLLSVPAGTSGSNFDERVIEKIKELRKIYQRDILIDGGVNKDNYQKILSAGATEVGANSAWWRGEFNNG